jgi:hypothetical protein
MLQSESVAIDNAKRDFAWIPLRTSKEAAELLEALRVSYQSLSREKRREVKHQMSRMFEYQGRSSTPTIQQGHSAIESRTN